MKRTLIVLAALALAVGCASTEASELKSDDGASAATIADAPTPSTPPAQLVLSDLSAGMKVCAHREERWNAEILDIYDRDGVNFITIREHLPAGDEDNSAMAAGYGLEVSDFGDVGSTTRLSAGHCSDANNLGNGPTPPATNEPFVLNFDEAGTGMQICITQGGESHNGVITNLFYGEAGEEMVSVDEELADGTKNNTYAAEAFGLSEPNTSSTLVTLGFCS